MSKFKEPAGVFGYSPEQWREHLSQCLESGDFAGLKEILVRFGDEIQSETTVISQHLHSPLFDRLVEQARRLVQSEPTDLELLSDELTSERKLWADFRRKYRETFVPESLHPYLDDLAVFVAPSVESPVYDGFDKYTGYGQGRKSEAVTLFDPHRDPACNRGFELVPNFFTAYNHEERRFIIHRAYRRDLPQGAGEECLFEHMTVFTEGSLRLAKLTVENVQNAATYAVFVSDQEGQKTVVEDPKIDNAPLVRLGNRLIERFGGTVNDVSVNLDSYGFLDLHMGVD